MFSMDGVGFVKVWFFAATFLVVPMVGLYFSVRCRNFISAFLLTIFFAVVLPMFFAEIACRANFDQVNQFSYDDTLEMRRWIYCATPFLQGGVGIYLLHKLKRKLNDRSFPLERTI